MRAYRVGGELGVSYRRRIDDLAVLCEEISGHSDALIWLHAPLENASEVSRIDAWRLGHADLVAADLRVSLTDAA